MREGAVPAVILHPRLRALYLYWRGLVVGGRLPRRQDIDATALGPLLPHINLLDVGATPDDLRYRLAGGAICQAFGFEPRGLTRAEIRQRHVAPAAHADFNETSRQTHDVAARRIIAYSHDRMTSYDRRFIAYARLMLPLSEDGIHATGVLGCILTSADRDPFWADFEELHHELPLAELGMPDPGAM